MTVESTQSSQNSPLHRLTPEFLDEILGEEALTWVREHNASTEAHLGALDYPGVQTLEEDILEVLESPERIPMVKVRGDYAYNFWTDSDNPRGLWRRQLLASYLEGSEDWEVLIDVDALSTEEDKSWVWHGASLCYPEFDRALVSLSNGGSDADETREFDLASKTWVEGGFYRPEAKGTLAWITRDLCWLSQPDDPKITSLSGYPLQASLLKRGEEISAATPIFTGPQEAMGVWAGTLRDRLGCRSMIEVLEDFYTADRYLLSEAPEAIDSESPTLIPVPRSSESFVWNEWTIVWLRDQWARTTQTYPSGALVAARTEELLRDPEEAEITALFSPTPEEVLEDVKAVRDHLIITSIRDVVSAVSRLTPPSNGSGPWEQLPLPIPSISDSPTAEDNRDPFVTVSVSAVDSLAENRVWMVTNGYTQPSALWIVDVDEPDEANLVRRAAPLFDSSGMQVHQHFAASKDGTKIPYFVVRKSGLDLPAPTLLYGYGGFDVSLLPGYSPAVGKAWLERGGVYVVANIRGGGEYGPEWHKSALKANRHRAYEDFIAVANDLVSRGVTTPAQLGAQGGSNGGLLMGNMYTQYADNFGAILCQVPLLDMGRYHTLLAGHSWMAEYGDPENPEEWEFIQRFSPVHLFDPKRSYPPLMITTSTKDDRVHPGHARSLGYLVEKAGKRLLYFENIEGGHAGAADNRQRAHNQALGWAFLWETLANS